MRPSSQARPSLRIRRRPFASSVFQTPKSSPSALPLRRGRPGRGLQNAAQGECVRMALEQPPEGQAAPANLLQRFVQRRSGQRHASELVRQRGREETGFAKGGHVFGRISAVRVAGCGSRERRLGDFTGDASDRLRVQRTFGNDIAAAKAGVLLARSWLSGRASLIALWCCSNSWTTRADGICAVRTVGNPFCQGLRVCDRPCPEISSARRRIALLTPPGPWRRPHVRWRRAWASGRRSRVQATAGARARRSPAAGTTSGMLRPTGRP